MNVFETMYGGLHPDVELLVVLLSALVVQL